MPRHTTAATGAKNGARWSTICTATSQESPAASAACTIGTAVFRQRVSRRVSSMAPTGFLTGRPPPRFPPVQLLERFGLVTDPGGRQPPISNRGHAAIDREVYARDEACFVGRKEQGGRRDLLRAAALVAL